MAEVQSVPLFTPKALTSFFDRKDDDYERIPLLAIGCFCLLTNKFQNWRGYDWGQVADLGKLGGTLSNLTDYWELVDFSKGAKKALSAAWPITERIISTVRQLYIDDKAIEAKEPIHVEKIAKEVFLFSCKAISNAVNFIERLQETKAFDCFCIHQFKLIGTALGSLYFSNALYSGLQNELDLSEKITKNDSQEIQEMKIEFRTLKEEAKETYLTQLAWENSL